MDYSVCPGTSFRLNVQMIADFLDEQEWAYILHRPAETPRFSKCMLYYGQRPLREDCLYIVPEGMDADFPADHFSYVTSASLQGEAPHIRNVRCASAELIWVRSSSRMVLPSVSGSGISSVFSGSVSGRSTLGIP